MVENTSARVIRLPCYHTSQNARGESKHKRVRGIEPPPRAWEAIVLPLNYTRNRSRPVSVNCTSQRKPNQAMSDSQQAAKVRDKATLNWESQAAR